MPSIGKMNISNVLNRTNIESNKNNINSAKGKLQRSKGDKQLLDACQQFESLFVHMMLKEMRSTVPDGGFIEKGQGTKIFEDMYDQEIAKNISKSKNQGIGLAKMIYEQMKQQRGNF